QGVWYVYAFCRKQRDFRLFRLGRVFSAFITEEKFIKRPFKREDIPLNYWTSETTSLDVRLEVSEAAFADAQDWLGGENLTQKDGKWYADVTLPDDEALVRKIIGLGAGVKVLSPAALQARVKESAQAIANLY
ncbi:MAG: WYL domain-containing protein, partial [Clostridia bacterium]|nr:WYL domain-containing protein [Clostridia bacterium]